MCLPSIRPKGSRRRITPAGKLAGCHATVVSSDIRRNAKIAKTANRHSRIRTCRGRVESLRLQLDRFNRTLRMQEYQLQAGPWPGEAQSLRLFPSLCAYARSWQQSDLMTREQITELHQGRGRCLGERYSCCRDRACGRHCNPLKKVPPLVPKVGGEAQTIQSWLSKAATNPSPLPPP